MMIRFWLIATVEASFPEVLIHYVTMVQQLSPKISSRDLELILVPKHWHQLGGGVGSNKYSTWNPKTEGKWVLHRQRPCLGHC